jgi:DNA (cytosine-5)-methyltransferase 1
MKKRVVELFAGVGGFRVGFNQVNKLNKSGHAIEKSGWDFVWANQWEPGTSIQHAFSVYQERFGVSNNHVNEDIFKVNKNSIPDHEVLVGGFPCQDYSVARSLSGEKGIEGKKGVLWWEIYKTIQVKRPAFVILENVDRLLKSPSKKRGRDFGIMLACFNDLDYNVEWRVINAADYGFPQRRKRVFIFASRSNLKFGKLYTRNADEIALSNGFFAKKFKVKTEFKKEANYKFSSKDLVDISNQFSASFYNTGIMVKGLITTFETIPEKAKPKTLGDILDEVSNKDPYMIKSNLDSWKYLKGGKKIERTSKDGFKYIYSEGPIAFPDSLDKPGRTMLTSESSLNRSSHIIFDDNIKSYRTLTPIEAERLNGFPDNWTSQLTDRRRFFMMGNALVTGLVSKIAASLSDYIEDEN